VQSERSHLPRLMDVRITGTKVVGDNRQLASCWPPMGTCASCGMESYRHLRAPCIAQDRRCNECGSDGHLARACKTKETLHVKENGGPAQQMKETTASRSGLPGGAVEHAQESSYIKKEPHSRPNLNGREGWTNTQGTQHRDSFDRGDTDMGSLSDGDDGASSSQGSVSEGQHAEGHAVETMELQPAEGQGLFHEPIFLVVMLRWKKNAHRVTRTRITQKEVWNTTAQLIGDRQEFQDAIATPALFLAVPEWLTLGLPTPPWWGICENSLYSMTGQDNPREESPSNGNRAAGL
jgi:hypothetical protein